MSSDFIIPKDAKRIENPSHILYNIDEWFCANCLIKGDGEKLDFVTMKESECIENKIVEYCCPECFETDIYITLNED